MKSFFRNIFIIILTLFFCNATLAQTDSSRELAKLLAEYKTYKANFNQLTYFNSSQEPQLSSGQLYMKRPGMFRWEINKPSQQVIIANRSVLWIYDVELQQVTKEKLNGTSSNNPAILLSGDVNELIKQYDVSKVQSRGAMWYQLKPRLPQSSFVLVRMRFSDDRLITIWVKNNLNQTSVFQFSNIQLNQPLSASLFNFKPPSGVDVLQ